MDWEKGKGREEKGWMVYHSSSFSVNKEGEEEIKAKKILGSAETRQKQKNKRTIISFFFFGIFTQPIN
jgi:hypothetical protein